MRNSKSILLIEDNKHDQFFFIQAISEIPNLTLYDIAQNGKEALELLRESNSLPDMIFSDINMPVMDGIECLSEIIKNPGLKDIPVVILSSDISKAKLLNQMGAKFFIEKPADFIILQSLIEQVMEMDFMTAKPQDQTLQYSLSAV
jgi:CheY-like chemotaxis protein